MNTDASPESTPVEQFLDEAKALSCVHCGLCLGSCPTYLETGNENDSPRGRIYLMRAVQNGRLPMAGTAQRHLDLCLGCRACETACPSGVPYGQLLETTRDHIERTGHRSLFQTFLRRYLIEEIFPEPDRLRLALLPAYWARHWGLDKLLPASLRNPLDLVPPRDELPPLPEISMPASSARRGRVGFMPGCVMSVLFQRTNLATVRLLNRAGYEVVIPSGQACCGALFAHGGNLNRARACARHNIRAFDGHALDAILINAAGCGSALKEYGHLLQDDPAWAEPGRRFSARVKDLTEWLDPAAYPPVAGDGGKVTYHDACHLAHPQRVTAPPRRLVQAVAGDRFVELSESDICCGSAGSYNLTEPAMAARLQQRKIQNILASGATTVVTTNPGCLLQIQAGLNKAGAGQVRALHLAEYLWQSLAPET